MPGPCHSQDRGGLLDPRLLVELRGSARAPRRRAWASVVARSRCGDPLERGPGVGEDAEAQRARDAEVARVDVDLDQLLALGVAPVGVVGDVEVADPRADDEQHVGLAARAVARRAEAEHVVRVVGRDARAPGHRGHHRAAEQLGDLERGCARAGAVDAAAGDHDRALGAREQLGRLRRAARPTAAAGPRGTRRARSPVPTPPVAGLVQDRRGQLDVHRAGSPVPHLAEGEAQHLGDARPLEDRAAPLHRRAGTVRAGPGPGRSTAGRGRRCRAGAGR